MSRKFRFLGPLEKTSEDPLPGKAGTGASWARQRSGCSWEGCTFPPQARPALGVPMLWFYVGASNPGTPTQAWSSRALKALLLPRRNLLGSVQPKGMRVNYLKDPPVLAGVPQPLTPPGRTLCPQRALRPAERPGVHGDVRKGSKG